MKGLLSLGNQHRWHTFISLSILLTLLTEKSILFCLADSGKKRWCAFLFFYCCKNGTRAGLCQWRSLSVLTSSTARALNVFVWDFTVYLLHLPPALWLVTSTLWYGWTVGVLAFPQSTMSDSLYEQKKAQCSKLWLLCAPGDVFYLSGPGAMHDVNGGAVLPRCSVYLLLTVTLLFLLKFWCDLWQPSSFWQHWTATTDY